MLLLLPTGTGKMKGKVALLTGADSGWCFVSSHRVLTVRTCIDFVSHPGIGRAVALAFAREGAGKYTFLLLSLPALCLLYASEKGVWLCADVAISYWCATATP